MNFYLMTSLSAFVITLSLSLFVYLKDKKNPINKYYGLMNFTLAIWTLWDVLSMFIPPADIARGIMVSRICYAFAIFTPVFYVQFVYAISRTNNVPFVLGTGYFASFLLLLAVLFNFQFVKGLEPDMVFGYMRSRMVGGLTFDLFTLLYFSFAFYGLYILFISIRRHTGQVRNQIKYAFLASVVAHSAGPIYFLTMFGVKIPALDTLLVTSNTVIVAYAITKHNMMDISVVISRTMAEVLTILFHGTIYLTLVWLYRVAFSTSIDLPFLIWTILYGILVGQTHQQIRIFLQTTADKLFLRGKYDYYKELSEASSRVGAKLSLPEILRVLYKTFQDVVEITNPRVYLPEFFVKGEETSDRYLLYDKETCLPREEEPALGMDSSMVKELTAARKPVFGGKELEAALLVPCFLEERLIAVFVLGPKLSEEDYTDEDMRLLNVLANQAAMALDHTRTYEKIKADMEAAGRQRIGALERTLEELRVKNQELENAKREAKEKADEKAGELEKGKE
ncbi:GAF domain-containing protein, partial [Candidatus Saganbacteria bacterium]|nr:GAF domain-containing protein [Candidatus Saganbacteria bacterium]